MSGLTIGQPVVSPISDNVNSGASLDVTDILYDYGVAGIGLLSGASPERPLTRQTAQYRKDQVDTTVQPGEQSTNFWWLRSQSSFHGGTGVVWEEPALDPGVLYSDPLSAVGIPVRYQDSEGVDPFTAPGQLSLLKQTVQVSSNTAAPLVVMGAKDGNGIDCWWEAATVSGNTALFRGTMAGDTPTRVNQAYSLGTSSAVGIANDGLNWYLACANGNIYTGSLAGGGSATLAWSIPSPTNLVIGWVKDRLLASCDSGLYELITIGVTPSPFATLPSNGWVFTSIAESASGIYLGGFSGTLSGIYYVTAGAGLQNVPILQQPVQVAVMPPNEQITALYCAEGAELVIGSTAGIRIADVDASNGSISFGPLVVPINLGPTSLPAGSGPVYGITAYGSYIYAAVGNCMADGSSGLIRINLGFQVAYELFAWAKDLRAHVTGAARGLNQFGTSGRLIFAVDGQGVFIQSASKYEATGYMNTGNIRFHTLDPKLFKYLNVKHLPIAGGSITASISFDSSGYSSLAVLGTTGGATDSGDISLPATGPHQYCTLEFTLTSGISNTVTPTMTAYQLKALPAQKNQRLIQVPVCIFDFMADRHGSQLGYEGYARDLINKLEAAEEARDAVTFQDFTTAPFDNRLVVIDQLEFQQTAPPEGFQGWGGYCLIALRTIT